MTRIKKIIERLEKYESRERQTLQVSAHTECQTFHGPQPTQTQMASPRPCRGDLDVEATHQTYSVGLLESSFESNRLPTARSGAHRMPWFQSRCGGALMPALLTTGHVLPLTWHGRKDQPSGLETVEACLKMFEAFHQTSDLQHLIACFIIFPCKLHRVTVLCALHFQDECQVLAMQCTSSRPISRLASGSEPSQ